MTACKNCPRRIELLPGGHWVDEDGFYQCKKMLDGERRMLHEPMPGSPVDRVEFRVPERNPRHQPDVTAVTEEEDDETGYLVIGGIRPRDIEGKHCKWCGEYVELRPMALPRHPGPYVAEFQHVISGLVHCSLSWTNGNLVGLAEETAQPCWKPGCLSNAEHEAKGADGEQ